MIHHHFHRAITSVTTKRSTNVVVVTLAPPRSFHSNFFSQMITAPITTTITTSTTPRTEVKASSSPTFDSQSLVQHLNSIDQAIKQDNVSLVWSTYQSMKQNSLVPDLTCYRNMIRYSSMPSSCKRKIYQDFVAEYYRENSDSPTVDKASVISPIMQLGSVLFEAHLIQKDWKEANSIFGHCMDQILQFTNENLNNKQENMYQNLEDKRECEEVQLIEQYLSSFLSVLTQQMRTDHLQLIQYWNQMKNQLKKANGIGSDDSDAVLSSLLLKDATIVQQLKNVHLSNLIYGLSLTTDIITRAQLYETENFKIGLHLDDLQYFIDLTRELHQFLKMNFPSPQKNVNYYQLLRKQAPDHVLCQDIRLMFQYQVQKKMHLISGYLSQQEQRLPHQVSSSSHHQHQDNTEVLSAQQQQQLQVLAYQYLQENRPIPTQYAPLLRRAIVQSLGLNDSSSPSLLPLLGEVTRSNNNRSSSTSRFQLDDDLMYNHDSW